MSLRDLVKVVKIYQLVFDISIYAKPSNNKSNYAEDKHFLYYTVVLTIQYSYIIRLIDSNLRKKLEDNLSNFCENNPNNNRFKKLRFNDVVKPICRQISDEIGDAFKAIKTLLKKKIETL